jgi:hypothetical protein
MPGPWACALTNARRAPGRAGATRCNAGATRCSAGATRCGAEPTPRGTTRCSSPPRSRLPAATTVPVELRIVRVAGSTTAAGGTCAAPRPIDVCAARRLQRVLHAAPTPDGTLTVTPGPTSVAVRRVDDCAMLRARCTSSLGELQTRRRQRPAGACPVRLAPPGRTTRCSQRCAPRRRPLLPDTSRRTPPVTGGRYDGKYRCGLQGARYAVSRVRYGHPSARGRPTRPRRVSR